MCLQVSGTTYSFAVSHWCATVYVRSAHNYFPMTEEKQPTEGPYESPAPVLSAESAQERSADGTAPHLGAEMPPKEVPVDSDGVPQSPDSQAFDEIVIYRSAWSELGKILLVILTGVVMVYVSNRFPWTVQHLSLGQLFGRELNVGIPLLGIIPLLILGRLAWKLLNNKYVLGHEHVTEVNGILSFKLSTTRLLYLHIRGVEIDATIFQRILNLGDVHLASDVYKGEGEIVFEGVKNPNLIKEVLQQRTTMKLREYRGGPVVRG